MLRILKTYFSEDRELLLSLKKILGFYPRNIELYKTALMHKSIMHRNEKGKPVNNERLEFLGDAVLDAVVGDIVFRRFPGKREGFLTNARSKMVQRETLGKLAKEMGISRLILSSSRSQSHNSYLGGNAFEALVGAIYLDYGYAKCMAFMQQQVFSNLLNVEKVAYKEVNFKSKLLEWSQKNRINLEYVLIKQSTDGDGSPVFEYKVMLEGVEGCQGKGFSKKEAQQLASKDTLAKIRKDKNYHDSIFAAKSERTKMEEQPYVYLDDSQNQSAASSAEPSSAPSTAEKKDRAEKASGNAKELSVSVKEPSVNDEDITFDDVDVRFKRQSREDIIAQAEAAAYA